MKIKTLYHFLNNMGSSVKLDCRIFQYFFYLYIGERVIDLNLFKYKILTFRHPIKRWKKLNIVLENNSTKGPTLRFLKLNEFPNSN